MKIILRLEPYFCTHEMILIYAVKTKYE